MKRAVCLVILIFLVQSVRAIPGMELYSEPDALSKIDMAMHVGAIPAETALLYKVMALTGTGELPQELQSETPVFCGTPLMDELSQKWQTLPVSLKHDITTCLPEARLFDMQRVDSAFVTAFTNLYPSLNKHMKSKKNGNHFVLYYSTDGSNAVSSVKYVKRVAKVLERSYKKIKKMYGKTPKNPDPMPVFFIEREYGACTYVGPSGNPPTAPSYITMERDLDQKDRADFKNYGKRLTDAVPCHEYFHAVQNNIDATEGKFMKESSSSWIEGVLYRNNKLYVVFRVPLVYSHPNWPLWYGSGYQGTLFQRFCQEHFNSTTMNAAMWKKCEETAGDNGMAAITAVLTDKGSTWPEAIKEYGAKNFFTRYWDYKKMKDLWPAMPKSGEHNSYGVEPTDLDTLYELGSWYVVFNPPAAAGDLKKGNELLVKFKQVTGTTKATLLMETKNRNYDMFDIPTDSTDANGYYEYMAEGFGKKYKKAVLMVQSRTSTGSDLNTKSCKYAAASPDITLQSFEAMPGSLGPGQNSTLTLTFDVKGCWNTLDYPLKYKMHIKGPGKVTDGVTDLVIQVRNGDTQKQNLYFYSGYGSGYTPGTYHLGIQFVFGSTKKMTSKTDIQWTSVTLVEVDNAVAEGETGHALPAVTIE
jgi:hypothetical protein